MKHNFPKNAFTKSITFPKTLFAVEYVIIKDETTLFYSKGEIYDNPTELEENAITNANTVNNHSKCRCTKVIVIPLILEGTRPQKKSYWIQHPESDQLKLLADTHIAKSNMILNFEKYRAIVTCAYYAPKTPALACAGYFKQGDEKDMQKVIKTSLAPAHEIVKEFAIYQIIRPHKIDLEFEKNLTN